MSNRVLRGGGQKHKRMDYDGFRPAALPRARQCLDKYNGARGRSISNLTVLAGLSAIISLSLMSGSPSFQLCALLVGAVAAGIDYSIEYFGIVKSRWNYPKEGIPVGRVPITVPLLFFCCGVIVTYTVYLMVRLDLISLATHPLSFNAGIVQVVLLILACFFLIRYMQGQVKTLTFWALPLSLSLYLSISEPLLLVVSVFPVYIDYFLEKRLVKKSDIAYADYNEQTAINVALSYFPTTLLIFEVVIVIMRIL